jgi:ornithine--oxo-acid transaminase
MSMSSSPMTAIRGGDNRLYEAHVNPQWVRLLDVLQMNVEYVRCQGAELFTSDDRRLLDFISGYCVHNAGHNHPRIIAALKDELDRCGPEMLQSHVSVEAGELAARLCALAGGKLTRAFFASSGSEGIETVIKFARAHTKRDGLLYAEGGFHGLTCGALSLMSSPFWKAGFGPMLPGTEPVRFGDLDSLAKRLRTKQYAAFIVEPIQAETGVVVPDTGYLRAVQDLCYRTGTLFVLDEVQTGLGRTGRFLAAHHFGVQPDMVVLAKALSGGLVPIGAVLMTEGISDSIYRSLQRAVIHTSTYSENGLAMRAGLATLDVLEDEDLAARAEAHGAMLRARLQEELANYEMVGEIRGLGLLNALEFKPPRSLKLRIPFEAFTRIHSAMFGQTVVMRLFRGGILSQICGNNFMVLKIAPPLVVTEAQLEEYVVTLREVVHLMHSSGSFWTEALGIARRVIKIV